MEATANVPVEQPTVIDFLSEDIERPENRYVDTPLVRMFLSRRFPRELLKDYAVLRWPFQASADLPYLISHVAYMQGDDPEHLLENAFEEILRPVGEGDHPTLWIQFAKGLGATQEELDREAEAPLAEVYGFSRTLTYYCCQSAEEGVAAWWADEEQLPEVQGATALAFRKFYDLDDETIEYFFEHVRADIEHSDATEDLLRTYATTPLQIARARRAAAVTLWAWKEMHEGILREIGKTHDLA